MGKKEKKKSDYYRFSQASKEQRISKQFRNTD